MTKSDDDKMVELFYEAFRKNNLMIEELALNLGFAANYQPPVNLCLTEDQLKSAIKILRTFEDERSRDKHTS